MAGGSEAIQGTVNGAKGVLKVTEDGAKGAVNLTEGVVNAL